MAAFKLKIALFTLTLITLSLSVPVMAQQQRLAFNDPVSGSVNADGVQTWTFTAQSGEVVSFRLEAESPDLDTAMTITDSSGGEVLSNDDVAYPDDLNPLLEAVTIPRTDTFTLTVSSVNATSGDYSLTMLPGYSTIVYTDDFSETTWQALTPEVTTAQSDAQLTLSISGVRATGIALDQAAETVSDFYAQADVVTVSNTNGWIVGMMLRQQGDSYYLLSINNLGYWRFTLIDGGVEQVVRDWTPHPNVVPGQTSFSIGVLAKDVGFDFFYNQGYIGSATDSTLTAAGEIGLMVGTLDSPSSETIATFDNLIVTQPAQIDGAYVIPTEISSGDGRTTVQALKRNHIISAAGELSLTIDSSSVQFARPGINRVMLGRGTQYQNFAIGTTVNIAPATAGPAGCGVVIRFTSENDYTLAYLDQQGAYGVSVRSGDTFSPGLTGVDSALGAGQHHLLLIAGDERIYYYIDRHLVGSIESTPQDGEVGIAVVNFEPNSTTCTYSNFWLWRWG